RSIRMHRCHGPTREIEVLRDELLDAFDSLPGLRASDILILAPDLDTYGPLAEAILKEREPSFPLRLSERRLDRSDPLVCGLQMLLDLAAGRVHLSDGLALIESPAAVAYVESLGIQPEEFAVRLRASGITWGLNAAHRQKMGAGHIATGTWREGLDRLLSGLWLGDAPAASDVTQRPALPVSGDLGGNPVAIGALLDWLDGLLSLLEDWQTNASPAQWADRCDQALEEVLGAGTDRFDSTAAVELVDQLRAGETEHACRLSMEAAAVEDWLGRTVQDEIRVVSRVGGGIAIGGFKPMRAIPCRVLAVLGLHDSAFPRRTRAAAWDLLAAAPRPGDRNPVQEDRQLFLDAILAAGDRVILTATARNIRTNKEEPLSACVEEFLWAAGKTASQTTTVTEAIRDRLIADHPLQPFNPVSFVGARASFDRGNLEIARAFLKPSSDTARFHADEPPRLPEIAPVDLDLHDLIRTLKDPWTAWLGSLKITLPRDGDDPFALDRDPVAAPTGLNRWQIQAQVLSAVMEGELPFLQERLAADRLIPYGKLGSVMARDCVQQALSMAHFAEKEAGGFHPHRLVYRDGHQQIAGTINLNGSGNLNVVIVAADLKNGPHHRLSAWVHAMFAAACGMKIDTLIVSRKDTGVKADRMPPMTQSLAKSRLHELLALFKQARLHPLPFAPKTSAAIFAATEDGTDEATAARKVWEEKFSGPPGDGQSASARLTWRGQDPFGEGTLDEWCRLAELVFRPMRDWFASTVDISRGESTDG
ncbi:MAG: hypothetical protein VX453_06710, partial [Acidobacteriota bacterium]|nr:hypothetical protein [Acidobacteriota bacterium]